MLKNKRYRKCTTESSGEEDKILLKKLPGLLALCEFILIPVLIVSPSLPTRSAGVYPPPGGTPNAPEQSSVRGRQGAALQARTILPSTQGEIQIAAITDIPSQVLPPPKQVMQVTVTAYSSTKDQTDNTPFHTANGNEVRDGIVAANFLPLGTRLRIPEIFGDKIFTVEDRMHERFDRHLDIWMPTREDAQVFGIRYLTVEIL